MAQQFTPGPYEPGEYSTTSSMLERLKRPQAAVFKPWTKTPAEPEPGPDHGMLMCICGDFADPQSQADARLFAAAPQMYALLAALSRELTKKAPQASVLLHINQLLALIDNPRPDAQSTFGEIVEAEITGLIPPLTE